MIEQHCVQHMNQADLEKWVQMIISKKLRKYLFSVR